MRHGHTCTPPAVNPVRELIPKSTPGVAGGVLRALQILEGKQSPAFVPLPMKLK